MRLVTTPATTSSPSLAAPRDPFAHTDVDGGGTRSTDTSPRDLICERLVLATAVCNELDAASVPYAGDRPRAALDLLRRWVGARYPVRRDTHPMDGLEKMVVPPGCERLMDDLYSASVVCDCLVMLDTADDPEEVEADVARLTRALDSWRRYRRTTGSISQVG